MLAPQTPSMPQSMNHDPIHPTFGPRWLPPSARQPTIRQQSRPSSACTPNAMVHAMHCCDHPTTLYEKPTTNQQNQAVHLPLTRTSLANPAHPRPRNNKHTLLESVGRGVRTAYPRSASNGAHGAHRISVRHPSKRKERPRDGRSWSCGKHDSLFLSNS